MKIQYDVGVENPDDHWAQFTLHLTEVTAPSIEIVLPSWVPGSYHIVDYVRKLRGVEAVIAGGGGTLRVRRVDKSRWRIETNGAAAIEVRYRVYGHELITEALDVTPEHLFLNAALCLPYVEGAKESPYDVVLHVPPGWRVVTELAEVGQHPPHLRASTYDELVDSPIDCGTPELLTVHPAGIPHRIVLCGPGGNHEAHRLEADLPRIVEATVRLFGDSPLRRYTFFLHLSDVSDGALEHATSNSYVLPRDQFRPRAAYEKFLQIVAHEYFHLYNVKRIRPKVLGPFDYTKENYTKLLWAMEGTTDYYGLLLLRRAGLLAPPKYLDKVAGDIQRYLKVPGRTRMSLEEASYTAWTDLYQPFEETINQSVSYYLKGELVSLCLDLEVRHRTENRSSLDEVLRHLWSHYGKTGRGLEEDEMQGVAEKVTGLDLSDFFRRYIAGTDEVDFSRFSRYAGLAFGPKEKGPDAADDPVPGHFGFEYRSQDGNVRLKSVLDGSPARRAGLTAGDEIVALNGAKVTHDAFAKALEANPPGTEVAVTYFRRGWLREATVTMGEPPPEKFAFTALAEPTPLATKVYESWLEAPWTPAKPGPSPS
ncbi:MAG: M61 family metallopeptidase [Thermoplasmata archaeon]